MLLPEDYKPYPKGGREDLMAIPHQNLVLEYNSKYQHNINITEEFDETIVESPNDIRLKALFELENILIPMEPNWQPE
jgi:hypothetical protein